MQTTHAYACVYLGEHSEIQERQHNNERYSFWSQTAWVHIPALPLTGWVTMGQFCVSAF